MKRLLFTILLLCSAGTVSAADIRSEIDRLFRQASSGELRFQSLVQPSKDSLSAMGDSAAKYLAFKLNTTDAREKHTLVDIYRGIGKAATPYLLAALDTDNKDQLRTTCRCLADVGDSTAIPRLFDVAAHPDATVRSEAVTAIGKSGGGEATAAALIPFLSDSISTVRKSCAAALGRLRSADSVPFLIQALNDEFFGVRLVAYDALIQIDTAAHESIIKLLTNSTNPREQALAIRLAGQLGIREALPLLPPSMRSDDETIRGWAVWSRGRIEGKAFFDELSGLRDTERSLFVRSLIDETMDYLDTTTVHE